jgi:hypothetical protein
MKMVALTCPVCGSLHEKAASHVNRSNKNGWGIYCGKSCSSIARKKNKSVAQKREEKRVYDEKRRNGERREEILAKKRDYHKRTYDPIKAAKYRKLRMQYHVEYCRSHEYKEYKSKYDKEYKAKKKYGDFWESAVLANEIRRYVVDKCGGPYEVNYAKGRYGRSQKARREFAAAKRRFIEIGALDSLERGQRR